MNLFRSWVGARDSGLPLWGSFSGEGAAEGGRLGRGRVAGSLVAPSWLKPCADAWVESGGSKPPWSGLRAGREGAQLHHCSGEPPCSTSLYRGNI